MNRTSLFNAILLAALFASVIVIGLGQAATAAPAGLTFLVNSTSDETDPLPGNGVCQTSPANTTCTLRAAIVEANAHAGTDTIIIPPGYYTFVRDGIDDTAAYGDLDILESVVISGSGLASTFVDGSGATIGDRVFHIVNNNLSVEMKGLSILHGRAPQGGGLYVGGSGSEVTLSSVRFLSNTAASTTTFASGGGLFAVSAHVVVSFSTFTANVVSSTVGTATGGGISMEGSSMLESSYNIISNNIVTATAANADGGGIHLSPGSTGMLANTALDGNRIVAVCPTCYAFGGGLSGGNASLVRSTLSDNFAKGGESTSMGGGWYAGGGQAMLSHSAIHGNYLVGNGGGVAVSAGGVLTVVNSTLSTNWATFNGGGATVGNGRLSLHNSTVFNNVADSDANSLTGIAGGGIFVNTSTPHTVTLANSVIAGNVVYQGGLSFGADDCLGAISSLAYNFIGTTTNCTIGGDTTGNQTGNAKLSGLAGNGGPSWSHMPQPDSPLINAGNPAGCRDALGILLNSDQRNYFRPIGGRCDIGAIEYGSSTLRQILLPLIMR